MDYNIKSRKGENSTISSIPLFIQKLGGWGKTTIMEDFNHRHSKRHTGD